MESDRHRCIMIDIQVLLPSLRNIERLVLRDKTLTAFLALHKLDFISTLHGYNLSVEGGRLTIYIVDMVFYFRLSDNLVLDGFTCRLDNVLQRDDRYVIEVGTFETCITPKYVPDNIADINAYIDNTIVPKVAKFLEIDKVTDVPSADPDSSDDDELLVLKK